MKTPSRNHARWPVARPVMIAATLLIAGSVAVFAVPDTPAPATGNASANAALTISVTQALPSVWPLTLSANGDIAAWQEAIIGSEAGNLRIEEVLFDAGDRVRKGQLLARLHSNTLRAELAQTHASLAEAQAMQAEAGANAERARRLQSSGAMSSQQINQLLTAEQTASARVAVLSAKITADEARLAQTQVRAPDDGVISARTATVGSVVQPGQELFRLIRGNRLEWRAEVPSMELRRLQPGMAATIVTASGMNVQGVVRRVAPTVDAQTRSGVAYVDITQAQDAKPGMFARGQIELGQSAVLTLPQSALHMHDGFHYVFCVDASNKVTRTRVTVGRRSAERVEVSGGIDGTQRVASSGVGFLADGDSVRISSGTTGNAVAASTTH